MRRKTDIRYKLLQLAIMFIIPGCVVPYIPDTKEKEEMIIVQGLITDQQGVNTIKLSVSNPLWDNPSLVDVHGCLVWITDDKGNSHTLRETSAYGIYATNPDEFRGEAGRTYTLHIKMNEDFGGLTYESLPMKMNKVPPIDSLYYVKESFDQGMMKVEGCQIYLNSHDPDNLCRFYRWDFEETWEIRLPFNVPNRVCWISNNSKDILIKNASILGQNVIRDFLLSTIPNPVDRLSIKYSIMASQYSLNEDEYIYWERIKTMNEQVGGLYDIIPAPVPNNIFCVENPTEKTLGYFSVSAVSTKRLFIDEYFTGINYNNIECFRDTLISTMPDTIPGLNRYIWLLVDNSDNYPPANIVTYNKNCADCTTRGTTVKPSYWDDDKK